MQRFVDPVAVWLTSRLTGDWLTGDACYRGRFIEPIDNPDQRIQRTSTSSPPALAQNRIHPPSAPRRHCCSARSTLLVSVGCSP